MKHIAIAAALLGSVLAAQVHADVVIVDKAPDLGAWWHPLDGSPNGTYVYANSFVFTGATGTQMTTVGAYMRTYDFGPGTPFQFQVLGDLGNSPDPGSVLAASGYAQFSSPDIALFTNSLTSSLSLVNGSRYWIALSTVGQASQGAYQFGGHTQGADGGTFWYSNDPAGKVFDGQRYITEMAIYASGTSAVGVPEPSTLAIAGICGLGLVAFGLRRRKDG